MSAQGSRQSSPGRDHAEPPAKRNTSCIVVRSKGQPEKHSIILTISTRYDISDKLLCLVFSLNQSS